MDSAQSPRSSLRDTLFADSPLEEVAATASGPEGSSVWGHFATAHQWVTRGNEERAIFELKQVLERTGLETRVHLQTWHCLRMLGQTPPMDTAAQIQGVVIEVALEGGLDLLAAYADHSARYYNYSGSGVVLDIPDFNIIKSIDELLAAGQAIISQIGLWQQPRPPAPPSGAARINLLTYGGLYFGQAELGVLAQDRLGGPAMQIATTLMQALIAKTTG